MKLSFKTGIQKFYMLMNVLDFPLTGQGNILIYEDLANYFELKFTFRR